MGNSKRFVFHLPFHTQWQNPHHEGFSWGRGTPPRCLNMVFNSTGPYQTNRFVFKTNDKSIMEIQNQGAVLGVTDALSDSQKRDSQQSVLKTATFRCFYPKRFTSEAEYK
ncbi:hypothetical protein MATL_G00094790 [Megalops atlanticus]|uniref:Uncharacterized protein n=1 Tax=Megalops atlanticus TaxID=7932 RepID=A0A9D3Q592_MEGAT|nr:hypothetical protein MATL_G00094790 [Megalops atlanticus]